MVEEPQVYLAEINLIWLAVSLALGAASSILLKKKQDKTVLLDDRPQTLATRGVHLPIALGINRVGATVAWIGRRDASGGDWFEDAVHLIALGPDVTISQNNANPQQKLRMISEDGVAIFDGRITPKDTPSGSSVLTRDGSVFKIYWGESRMPTIDKGLNSEIFAGSTAPGAELVEFPYFMRIWWIRKKLGPVSIWPQIDYDIEIHPQTQNLKLTRAWHEETTTIGKFLAVLTNRSWSTAARYFSVWRCWNNDTFVKDCRDAGNGKIGTRLGVSPGSKIIIQGATGGNGAYTVTQVQFFNNIKWTHPVHGILAWETRVYVAEKIDALVWHADARIAIEEGNDDAGANPAHLIDQLMFAPWPHGLSMDVNAFDLASLESVGQKLDFTVVGEKIAGHILLANGATFSEVMGLIFQDLGLMLALDPITKKHIFHLVREPSGALPHLEEQMILPPRTEIETVHEEIEKSDHIIFVYRDQNKRHRDATIIVDDEGRARRFDSKKARKIPITVARDLRTAGIIANRRQQEDFSGGVGYRIPTCRAARLLRPGRAFTAFDIPDILRVLEVLPSTLSSKCVITAIKDHFGVPISLQSHIGGGKGEPPADPIQDINAGPFEAPGFITLTRIALWVPRIRFPKRSFGASIRLFLVNPTQASPFGIDTDNFEPIKTVIGHETGGTLDAAIEATDPWNDDQSVNITQIGEDLAAIKDLSSDPQRWRQGVQIMVVEQEIIFLRGVTAMGGDTYRLDGLLRARFGTDKVLHSSSSTVFIFPNTIELIESDLLSVGATAHIITVPTADEGLGFQPDTDVEYFVGPLKGRGIAPLNPENLRTSNLRSTYAANKDLELKWSYRVRTGHKARTGAGMQGAGTATDFAPPEGKFVIEFLTDADTLKRTVEVTAARIYTYPIDTLRADFGGEPLIIKVKLHAELNGLSSEKTLNLTIDKSDDTEDPLELVTPQFNHDHVGFVADFIGNSSDWDFNTDTGIPGYEQVSGGDKHPGAVRLLSGSASGGWSSMVGNASGVLVTAHTVFEAHIKSNTFGNPEAEVVRVGLMDEPDAPIDGVYFEHAGAVDDFWQLVTRKVGSTTETTTSVNSHQADGYFRLRIELENEYAKGAPTTAVLTARFFIDDIYVGTHNTNIPVLDLALAAYCKRASAQELKTTVDLMAYASSAAYQRD